MSGSIVFRFLVLSLLGNLLLDSSLLAQSEVPPNITFQGLLSDSSGTPIDGSETVMFTIYRDAVTATASWSETQVVDFANGVFNVYLGDVAPIPDSIFNGQALYLGIKVSTDEEMTPRPKLVTSPYSFLAGQASCIPGTWFEDADGDLYGNAAADSTSCVMPMGYAANNLDCDDADVQINPGESEVCDGLDNNCGGGVDEGVTLTFCADNDGDGFGDAGDSIQECAPPEGYVTDCDDCDDTNPSLQAGDTYYPDDDGDGFGLDTDPGTNFCVDPGFAWVLNNLDCDDSNASISPAELEICDNGIDDDCDDLIDGLDADCP